MTLDQLLKLYDTEYDRFIETSKRDLKERSLASNNDFFIAAGRCALARELYEAARACAAPLSESEPT